MKQPFAAQTDPGVMKFMIYIPRMTNANVTKERV